MLPQADSVANLEVSSAFVARVPIAFARRFSVIGLQQDDATLRVALANADNLPIADKISVHLGVPVEVVLAPQDEIHAAINRAYSAQDSRVATVLGGLAGDDPSAQLESFVADNDLLDAAGSAPVVQLVNSLLFDAIKRRASDVHIQPFAEHVQVRLRIDGVLYDDVKPPRRLLDEIVSRIKVIGKMDIVEKRLAQDGRTTVTLGDRPGTVITTERFRTVCWPTCCSPRHPWPSPSSCGTGCAGLPTTTTSPTSSSTWRMRAACWLPGSTPSGDSRYRRSSLRNRVRLKC